MPSASVSMAIFVLIVSANACPPSKPQLPEEFDSTMPEYVNHAVKRLAKEHSDANGLKQALFVMLDRYFPKYNVHVLVFDPIVDSQIHAHQSSNGQYIYYLRAEQRFNIVINKGREREDGMFNVMASRISETIPSPQDRNAKNLINKTIRSLEQSGAWGRAVVAISVVLQGNIHLDTTASKTITLEGGHGFIVLYG